MFRTCVIKNSKRTVKKRIADKPVDECSETRPDERTLPYFEIVSEQVLADKRYQSMQPIQQGHFWRLVVHVLAIDRGLTVRHPGAIAKRLGISKSEWEELEHLFLEKGILTVTEDDNYLLQHEFREQYLQTLESNNAKR